MILLVLISFRYIIGELVLWWCGIVIALFLVITRIILLVYTLVIIVSVCRCFIAGWIMLYAGV